MDVIRSWCKFSLEPMQTVGLDSFAIIHLHASGVSSARIRFSTQQQVLKEPDKTDGWAILRKLWLFLPDLAQFHPQAVSTMSSDWCDESRCALCRGWATSASTLAKH